jgi:hypothetical protein
MRIHVMMNEYVELLQQKLCTTNYCTTCGNMEFRSKCKDLGDRLFHAMMELTEDEVMKCHNYLESINITIRCIPDTKKRVMLSNHWPQIFKMLLEDKSLEYNGILMTGVFREFETPTK